VESATGCGFGLERFGTVCTVCALWTVWNGLGTVYEMRILGRKGSKNRFTRFGTVYGGAARKPNGGGLCACSSPKSASSSRVRDGYGSSSLLLGFARFRPFPGNPLDGFVRTKTEIGSSAYLNMTMFPDIYLTKTAHELRMPA
jgi:hypothetical protein